jgi:hypothetical protein
MSNLPEQAINYVDGDAAVEGKRSLIVVPVSIPFRLASASLRFSPAPQWATLRKLGRATRTPKARQLKSVRSAR